MSHLQNYRIPCLTLWNRFVSDGWTQLWNLISCLFKTKQEITIRWAVLSFTAPHFRTWFFSYLMSRTSLEAPLRLLFWDAPGRSLRGKFGVSCASELRLPLKQRRVVLSFWPSAARSGLPPAVLRFAPASGHKMYRKSHHLLQELIPVLVITHCYKELLAKHVLLTCSLFLLKNVDGYSVQR